ncbi:hypothetical protein [Leucobacter sp. NPDC077196]|uniref:cytidylyltransferase domain-containing protein n=1 Tax=Leucobacter sp. NPDC077196 TaxID=3154959 RepID=UPI0034446C65
MEGVREWVIIPARGGSVGVPRKNLRIIAGKPLICHVIDTALQVLPRERVVVVTDDTEIRSVAESRGVVVVLESFRTPPEETLDEKVRRNLPELRRLGAEDGDLVLTVQPTSPLLAADTVRGAIGMFDDPGVKSVLTVAKDQHLRWRRENDGAVRPAFAERVNRQQLPLEYRETGGVIAARLLDIERAGTRVIEPVRVLELDADEAVDIDSHADLLVATHLLSRMEVAIRVDASTELGMGHVYRMLALAAELARHRVTIYVSEDAPLGRRFFAQYPYRTVRVADQREFLARVRDSRAQLVVLDVLDTTVEQIRGIRSMAPEAKIVSFEDRGAGAEEVDLLVTEFIDTPEVPEERKVSGIDFALLAPSFEIEQHGRERGELVENVLVLFGGTDPAGLADRALRSLARVGYSGAVTVARGLGARAVEVTLAEVPYELDVLENVANMPALMAGADVAFTSAGRTIIELASQGTPSICLAQNDKELTHTHAVAENGVLALGLGTEVDDAALDAATRLMLEDPGVRARYAESARRAGAARRNSRTLAELLTRIGFEAISVF